MNRAPVVVGVVMGSSSDWDTLRAATEILAEFEVPHEALVVSAHRMPDDMFAYAQSAADRGLVAIIAGAGGAAHLPGMLAAKTTVPVLGVPVASRHLQGVDSLHSIVQMPKGIPVAHVCHWRCRCGQRGTVCGGDAGHLRPRIARQARRISRPPDGRCARHDGGAEMSRFIAPSATLGVMGGGQLGRMFVHAAQQMGYFTAVLDADPASPAGLVAHYHIQTDYLDEQGLAQLMQRSAAITTEFENVPAAALLTLGAQRQVAPGAEAVAICQDRAAEKAHFVRSGVACAPHALIATADRLAAVTDDLLPGILKTAQLGYDGKGQSRVRDRAELQAAWDLLKGVPCVLERMLPLAHEISVIVARSADGRMVNLPVQQNLHRGGILAVTQVPRA